LESIVIDESARRKGAGAALLSELFRWAATNEASRVELEVHAGNKTAIEFYEKYGFELDGLRRGYYRNPEGDAVLMSRALCS
jgi:ribosomal-protein-alanine N-acetyltransferase